MRELLGRTLPDRGVELGHRYNPAVQRQNLVDWEIESLQVVDQIGMERVELRGRLRIGLRSLRWNLRRGLNGSRDRRCWRR